MNGAILFDYGGTLDADGVHWLDRFFAIYDRVAPGFRSRDAIKRAFYDAVAAVEGATDIRSCGLRELVRRHVAEQCRRLDIADPALEARIARAFEEPAAWHLERNRGVLDRLHQDGWQLGVVSNFYGNLATICREFSLTPFLDVILDSAVVGLRKPDARFLALGLERLGASAADAFFVGDSLDRDIRPARSLAMKTVWLCDDLEDPNDGVGLVDVTIRELPEVIGVVAAFAERGASR